MVFEGVYTKADAEILLGYIDMIVDSLYGLDSKSFEGVAKKMPEEKIAMWLLAEIRKIPENLRKDYLRKLKGVVKSCEVVKMTVAVDVNRETVEEIVEEIRKKKEGVIAEVEVDPRIGGGARIYWQGRLWDKTLAQKYDQI